MSNEWEGEVAIGEMLSSDFEERTMTFVFTEEEFNKFSFSGSAGKLTKIISPNLKNRKGEIKC